jgi:hypothetical protein
VAGSSTRLGGTRLLRFDVGDAAALYLTIPKADLRAGRFNRVDGEMQES